ncbi:MAG TPA: pyridoxal-phosphate dependent enzyme [Longimicrobiales bacterium]|nr:pyridoxal-phosphate dependent enzyme [Longimicrobiales bacterium]
MFPQLGDTIAWLPLASLPTPVQKFSVVDDAWIKRDDLSATPYGGNKVRKLEYLLADAQRKKSKRLITVGAAGSHHALATTIYGKRLGFDVTLVLFPQPLTAHVKQILLLDQAYGAELRYTRRMELVPAALFTTTVKYRNQNAYVIPAGGSDAVGTLGYIDAALEFAEQVKNGEAPAPKTVIVAAGTLGTAAGLAIGFTLAGLDAEVHAVRITSRLVTNERALARLIRDTQTLLRRAGANVDFAEPAIARARLIHEHIGPGYGKETKGGAAATELFAAQGIHLDPTYTAKAAAALMASASSLPKPILFWQTLSAAEPIEKLTHVTEADLPAPFRAYLAEEQTNPVGAK